MTCHVSAAHFPHHGRPLGINARGHWLKKRRRAGLLALIPQAEPGEVATKG